MIEISSVKKYYDEHVIGKLKGYVYGNERVERAYTEMISWVRKSPLCILEIGCGIGDILYRISNKYPEANCYGFDVSPKSIEIANALFKKTQLTFICADDISAFPESGEKFDLIFMIDVFEHIPPKVRQNLYDFIKEMIADNGVVFLSCPTIAHQNFLRGNNPSGLQPVDEDITIADFLEVSKLTELDLRYFKKISVWNEGDYSHAVFGNFKFVPHSDRICQLEKSIKRRIYEKLTKSEMRKKNHEQKLKLERIGKKLGKDFTDALMRC